MLFTEPLPDRIVVEGSSVEYLRIGMGRSLLYLHGLDGVSPDDPFLALLAAKFDVIAPSLPGFGASSRQRSMRNVEDLAHFGLAFARTLALEDAVLVGSSFGGWLAAEIATKGSPHFAKLVLADALGARFTSDPTEREIVDIFTVESRDYPSLLFADAAIGWAAFRSMDFANMSEVAALRFCTNREGITQFGWSPLLYNTGLLARLGLIDVPTLVLWGEQDRLVPVSYGRRYAAAIPGATFETVAHAGHYLPLEQPEMFASRIIAFAGRRAAIALP